MTLFLKLEYGPRAQAVREARLDRGEIVIGRGAEAGWQIDDPDMFVSRAHCRIAADGDSYVVTDLSSSGLFLDNSPTPLGAGNLARLRDGMRLRLGDYIVAAEVKTAGTLAPTQAASPPPASAKSSDIGSDDFFSLQIPEEPRRPRPSDLPNPFDQPVPSAFERSAAGERSSAAFDDPFSLDPIATPPSGGGVSFNNAGSAAFDDPFRLDPMSAPALPVAPTPVVPRDFDNGFGFGPADDPVADAPFPRPQKPGPREAPEPAPWEMPNVAEREPARPGPAAEPPATRDAPRPRDVAKPPPAVVAKGGEPPGDVLREAFLRGLGFEDAGASQDPVAEMEKFGREYRVMMEGLMQLLRKRAEEKGNARVAQTVVGSSAVNPLKFLPTVDDVLATIMSERSPGFLAGEPALRDAVRDLAQHHVRAWRGVQGALRSMIDRFDPASLEAELKENSAIGTLLSGGRSAKLWELYQKRHREIAQSAESRFLGEIGADFRDAYEEE